MFKLPIVCKSWYWTELTERPHQEMMIYSNDVKIIYVQGPKWFVTKIKRKIKPVKINDNLIVYTPTSLFRPQKIYGIPFTIKEKINQKVEMFFLKRFIKKNGIDKYIYWSYEIWGGRYSNLPDAELKVYTALTNAYSLKDDIRKKAVCNQNYIISNSNIMFSESQNITDDIYSMENSPSKPSGGAYLSPSAVSYDFFNDKSNNIPEEIVNLKKKGRKIICCVGAITELDDILLLKHCCNMLPELDFLIVGPVRIDITELDYLKNLYFTGKKDYDSMPGFMHGADVLIKIFKGNHIRMKYSSPLTLYEYLTTGKPVVTTRFPETELFSDLLYISDSYDEFVENIKKALDEKDEKLKEKRIEAAINNTWENRCKFQAEIINDYLKAKE